MTPEHLERVIHILQDLFFFDSPDLFYAFSFQS